jgi:hypothetical protein
MTGSSRPPREIFVAHLGIKFCDGLHWAISGLMQRIKYSSFDHLMPLPFRSLIVHLQSDPSLGVQ